MATGRNITGHGASHWLCRKQNPPLLPFSISSDSVEHEPKNKHCPIHTACLSEHAIYFRSRTGWLKLLVLPREPPSFPFTMTSALTLHC